MAWTKPTPAILNPISTMAASSCRSIPAGRTFRRKRSATYWNGTEATGQKQALAGTLAYRRRRVSDGKLSAQDTDSCSLSAPANSSGISYRRRVFPQRCRRQSGMHRWPGRWLLMARYYFHTEDGVDRRDNQGTELSDFVAAMR